MITTELDTEMLYENREQGTVTTLTDRRWDVLDALHDFESRAPNGSKAKDT